MSELPYSQSNNVGIFSAKRGENSNKMHNVFAQFYNKLFRVLDSVANGHARLQKKPMPALPLARYLSNGQMPVIRFLSNWQMPDCPFPKDEKPPGEILQKR